MSWFTPLALLCLAWMGAGCGAPSELAVQMTAAQEDDLAAGTKGLPLSANVPSFMPKHLTGQHEGKDVCPLCAYGLVPQLQIWVQEENLQEGLVMARLADRYCVDARASADKRPVAYLVVVPRRNGRISEQSVSAIRAIGAKCLFATEVPSWEDPPTSGLYGHANSDKPRLRVYSVVNRRLFKRWDDPSSSQWPAIEASLVESARYVTNSTLADSAIAPAWEPGQRLEVRFRVVDKDKRPLSGVKVTAMQADATGHYNPDGWNRRDPRLKTLAWTDGDGWITFTTIMPGQYPNHSEPAHIHFDVIVNGTSHYRTLWFEGDSLLSRERRTWADRDEETVIVPLARSGAVWQAEHSFQIK
ncbi:MAG: hypothetical protein M9921_11790 [Fimbriimonadaceae bacterium]|nr:hypothetical protein [Chthonomonadaceae bacterium]MCO5297528.1 hypothetical protein [Fimbriimonadaceae bacterium]